VNPHRPCDDFSEDVIGRDRDRMDETIALMVNTHSDNASGDNQTQGSSPLNEGGEDEDQDLIKQQQRDSAGSLDSEQYMEDQIALQAMQSAMKRVAKRDNNLQYTINNKLTTNDSFNSDNSFYTTKEFQTVRNELNEKEISSMKIEFYIDIVVLILILGFLIWDKSNHKGCGIPIREWLIVFFIIWLSKSAVSLMKIPIIRNHPNSKIGFSTGIFLVMNGLLICWLVFGNVIWFSDDNNCGSVSDTKILNYLMLAILIIGYIVIAFYLIILCIAPCIYV